MNTVLSQAKKILPLEQYLAIRKSYSETRKRLIKIYSRTKDKKAKNNIPCNVKHTDLMISPFTQSTFNEPKTILKLLGQEYPKDMTKDITYKEMLEFTMSYSLKDKGRVTEDKSFSLPSGMYSFYEKECFKLLSSSSSAMINNSAIKNTLFSVARDIYKSDFSSLQKKINKEKICKEIQGYVETYSRILQKVS